MKVKVVLFFKSFYLIPTMRFCVLFIYFFNCYDPLLERRSDTRRRKVNILKTLRFAFLHRVLTKFCINPFRVKFLNLQQCTISSGSALVNQTVNS
jgi:hypothetical protein